MSWPSCSTALRRQPSHSRPSSLSVTALLHMLQLCQVVCDVAFLSTSYMHVRQNHTVITRWLTELAEKMACAEITRWRDKTLLCARVLTAWRDVLVTSWTCDESTGILSSHSVEAGCKLHFLCIYVWLTRRTLRLVPFITRGFPKRK